MIANPALLGDPSPSSQLGTGEVRVGVVVRGDGEDEATGEDRDEASVATGEEGDGLTRDTSFRQAQYDWLVQALNGCISDRR
jgi:hypothetical protein